MKKLLATVLLLANACAAPEQNVNLDGTYKADVVIAVYTTSEKLEFKYMGVPFAVQQRGNAVLYWDSYLGIAGDNRIIFESDYRNRFFGYSQEIFYFGYATKSSADIMIEGRLYDPDTKGEMKWRKSLTIRNVRPFNVDFDEHVNGEMSHWVFNSGGPFAPPYLPEKL